MGWVIGNSKLSSDRQEYFVQPLASVAPSSKPAKYICTTFIIVVKGYGPVTGVEAGAMLRASLGPMLFSSNKSVVVTAEG